MTPKEMREVQPAQLQSKIVEWDEQLFRFRCEKKVGQLENPSQMAKTRRMIARAKTILQEKKNAEKQ